MEEAHSPLVALHMPTQSARPDLLRGPGRSAIYLLLAADQRIVLRTVGGWSPECEQLTLSIVHRSNGNSPSQADDPASGLQLTNSMQPCGTFVKRRPCDSTC